MTEQWRRVRSSPKFRFRTQAVPRRDLRHSFRFADAALGLLSRYKTLLIGIGIASIILVLMRGNWLLSSNMLNPDEAQLLAAGKQARLDFVPYQSYTTYTYFFLWPVFLGFVSLVGIPLSFATAHVMGALFALFLVVTGWYLVSREYGWRLAAAVVVPGALYYFADADSGTTSLDLYSLTTESLPIAIIFMGLAVLMTSRGSLSTRRFIVGSVICGVALWAKPQMGPLALAIVYSCALIRVMEAISNEAALANTWRSRLRVLAINLGTGTLSFGAPSLVSIAFLAVVGELGNFVHLGLHGTGGVLSYISAGNTAAPSPSGRFVAVVHYVEQYHVVLYWALAGVVGWRAIVGPSRRLLTVLRVVCWSLPLSVAIGTLAVLDQVFLHYSNVLFAGSMASAVVGARLCRFSRRDFASAHWRRRAIAALSLAAAASVFVDSGGWGRIENSSHFAALEVKSLVTTGQIAADGAYNTEGSRLTNACPSGSQVFVFGWGNELYSYYDWTPADEFLVENWGIPHSSATLTASRLTATALERVRPKCIVQAIGPYFLGSIPPADTLERVLPGIRPLIRGCYRGQSTVVGIAALGWTGEAGQTVRYWTRRSSCR